MIRAPSQVVGLAMTEAVDALPPLREVVAAHGLAAKKRLGQHFLLDLNLTRKIARSAGDLSTGSVIEVGPGPGGLTRAILQCGARNVVAIEKDPRCVDALGPLVDASDGALTVLSEDATTIGIGSLGTAPRRIIANLPYNVGTPLLIGWLHDAAEIHSMTLMFQKEVAERICAQPGQAQYGRLSVLCNWRCTTEYLFTLPARAFTPPPKIDSAVVRLTPHQTLPFDGTIEDLQTVTAAAFGQRRKTLRRSLRQLNCDAEALLQATGIDGALRAETLTIEDYGRLAAAFSALKTG